MCSTGNCFADIGIQESQPWRLLRACLTYKYPMLQVLSSAPEQRTAEGNAPEPLPADSQAGPLQPRACGEAATALTIPSSSSVNPQAGPLQHQQPRSRSLGGGGLPHTPRTQLFMHGSAALPTSPFGRPSDHSSGAAMGRGSGPIGTARSRLSLMLGLGDTRSSSGMS